MREKPIVLIFIKSDMDFVHACTIANNKTNTNKDSYSFTNWIEKMHDLVWSEMHYAYGGSAVSSSIHVSINL